MAAIIDTVRDLVASMPDPGVRVLGLTGNDLAQLLAEYDDTRAQLARIQPDLDRYYELTRERGEIHTLQIANDDLSTALRTLVAEIETRVWLRWPALEAAVARAHALTDPPAAPKPLPKEEYPF